MYFILLLFLSHLSFISPLENGSRKCIIKECYDVKILRQYKLCVCAREETLSFWLSIKCKLNWHFGIDTFKSILSEVWILISACHAAYWLQSLRYILSAAIQNVLLCMTDFDVSVCLVPNALCSHFLSHSLFLCSLRFLFLILHRSPFVHFNSLSTSNF